MRHTTRKEFLQTSSALLLGAAFAPTPFDFKKEKLPLAFSTLACPDWDFKKITDYAKQHGYTGIELRGLKREIYLPKCPEFSSTKNIDAVLKIMKDKKLRFVDLGSSSTLHFGEGAEREKNIHEGKTFIDLAQQLNCPNVRVYPNLLPKDRDKDETMEFIAKGLMELGNYAKASGVMVLMETHGDLVWTQDIDKIMQHASHSNVGLVWDPCNMWTITKEPPAEMYRILKKYIYHTHIKDAKLADGKLKYVALGTGDTPIFEAVDLLVKDGYKGYYSFEWEKMWHPEIDEPETALADYPLAIKKHLG